VFAVPDDTANAYQEEGRHEQPAPEPSFGHDAIMTSNAASGAAKHGRTRAVDY